VTARPSLLPVAAEAVLIIKAVERVGDHAKNIAKHVLYLVGGRDVRHVKSKRLAETLGLAEGEVRDRG
jgi:phosphate transport system protein